MPKALLTLPEYYLPEEVVELNVPAEMRSGRNPDMAFVI